MEFLITSTKLSSVSCMASFFVKTLDVIGDNMLLKGKSSPFNVSKVT